MHIRNTGIVRNRCPKCGSKIIVSNLVQKSYEYIVKKDGTLPKRPKRVNFATDEGMVACCSNYIDCGVQWDIDEFEFDTEGRFVDLKYAEEDNG